VYGWGETPDIRGAWAQVVVRGVGSNSCARIRCTCLQVLVPLAFARMRAAPHSPLAPPVECLARPSRSHPWLGAPGYRHAVAMHRPAHRRAAHAGDTACSTHCRQLERLAWSSPPSGTACPRHAPGSVACRHQQLPWCSPRAGTACPRHARCSEARAVGCAHPFQSPGDSVTAPAPRRRGRRCTPRTSC
jgi:hypothetical protein